MVWASTVGTDVPRNVERMKHWPTKPRAVRCLFCHGADGAHVEGCPWRLRRTVAGFKLETVGGYEVCAACGWVDGKHAPACGTVVP